MAISPYFLPINNHKTLIINTLSILPIYRVYHILLLVLAHDKSFQRYFVNIFHKKRLSPKLFPIIVEKRRCISGEKRNLFLMFTNIVCKTKQFYFLPAIFKNWNYAMTSPKPYFIGLKCNKNTIESTAIWHKNGMWNKKESFRNTNENVSYGINVYLQSLNNTYSPWVG